MKKNLLCIVAIFFTVKSFAQIPNNGFENWTTVGTYEDPDKWATLNYLSAVGYPITVTKSTDKNTGAYSIRLESKVFTNFLTGTADTAAGLTSTGTATLSATDLQLYGFPYTQRPTSLTGYYKYAPVAKDSAFIATLLTKWNPSKKGRDTIAFGGFTQKNLVFSYTKFTIPLFYSATTANPDSAIIVLSANNIDNPKPGAVLFVDDLAYVGATGVFSARPAYNNIIVYPNPSTVEIHLKNLPAEASLIEVADFTGKPIETATIVSKDEVLVKTDTYTPGIYLYSIRNTYGERIATGKFTVVK